MQRQFLHTRLVTQDTALGALRGGVDGQDSQLAALLLQHMDAKLVDTRRLTCARHAADAHTDTVTTIGQTLVNHLLRLCLMVGIHTLYQRHRLRQDGDIALQDALYHIGRSEFTTTEAVALQIGIDDRWLLNTTVDLQTCKFRTVLRMLHSINSKLYITLV